MLTPHPNWVYEMYDERILVERVHRALENYIHNLFTRDNQVKVPMDPVALSFWVPTNLPITDAHRIKILKIDSAVQRLRYELSLLTKVRKD